MRMLVADDHAIVRNAVIELLKEEYPHASFEEASDAAEIISLVMKTHFDLIVCDLNMPGRTGLDALKQVKQLDSSVPVLIMSIFPEEQYAVRAFKSGASGYLFKGNIHTELIKAAQYAIIGKKFISPQVAEFLAEAISDNEKKHPHELLSDREFEIFKLLAAGRTITEIAAEYFLTTGTVRSYRTKIMEKMQFKTSSELVRYALEKKIIT